VAGSKIHISNSVIWTLPTYVSGRRRTCSIGVFFWYIFANSSPPPSSLPRDIILLGAIDHSRAWRREGAPRGVVPRRAEDDGDEGKNDEVELREGKEEDDEKEDKVEVEVLSPRLIALAALWSCPCREMRNSMVA